MNALLSFLIGILSRFGVVFKGAGPGKNQMFRRSANARVRRSLFVLLSFVLGVPAQSQEFTYLKPRLIVLTDIFTLREPDDTQSMIRLLAYADLVEIEGLVATAGYNLQEDPNEHELETMILYYSRDIDKLMRRSNQTGFRSLEQEREAQDMGYWPSPDYLRSIIREGQKVGGRERGLEGMGEGKDSEGSDLIIQVVDEPDERPVHIAIWGGANTLAQALYKVRSERNAEDMRIFLSRMRVFSVIDQDNSGPWIREQFPDLFYLWNDYYKSAYRRREAETRAFAGTHYTMHGALGSRYVLPPAWVTEGDTPSFAGLLNPGLSNYASHPEWGGWGGRFLGTDGLPEQVVHEESGGHNAVLRWHSAFLTDLAARLDWANSGRGNRNPLAVLNGDQSRSILSLNVRAGATVTLDASGSRDPDGDSIRYVWWIYQDAGTYSGKTDIAGSRTSEQAQVTIPVDAADKTIHVILEVWDEGQPALVSYRRAVLYVE